MKAIEEVRSEYPEEAIERKKNLVALTPQYIIISLKTTQFLRAV